MSSGNPIAEEMDIDDPPPEKSSKLRNLKDRGPTETRTGVPKAKVTCLLCGGYISYKHGDSSRFSSHLEEEHEVKFDTDVLLACSVLNSREKQLLVQATQQRLKQVGSGMTPTAPISSAFQQIIQNPVNPPSPASLPVQSNSLQSKVSSVSPIVNKLAFTKSKITSGSLALRGRGRGGSSGGALSSRITPPQIPMVLNGINQSISISVVDQRTPCSHCNQIFATREIMTDHMKKEHLTRFPGLTINTPSEVNAREKQNSIKSSNESTKPMALEYKPSTPQSSEKTISLNSSSIYSLKNNLLKNIASQPQNSKQVASVIMPADSVLPNSINKNRIPTRSSKGNMSKVKIQRQDKVVDYVDIIDNSDDEEKHLKSPINLIECPQCEKKLANNMALRMHMNLKHPVKTEVDDSEELLAASDDESSSEIKNEVDGMETLELLDNLVNFLETET